MSRAMTAAAIGALSVFALVPRPGFSQGESGSISGKLIDPNGSIVTGLDTPIHLTHNATDVVYSADVSVEGSYAVDGLPAGSYRLSFPTSCCMYASYNEDSVAIAAGEPLVHDLNLQWHINLGTIGDDPGMLGNDMRSKSSEVSDPAPRFADGTPDLSGIWYNIASTGPGRQPAMQPWAQDIARQLREMNVDPIAGAYCLPYSAVPTTLNFPYKIVQTPDLIVQISEFVTPAYRQIFLDGRDRPEFWNPSWYGHSLGHWDGDTLVVETIGYNEITPGFGIHSESLRIVERYRRTSFGTLELEVTAEDPDAWTEPFTIRRTAGIAAADQEILEFVCMENNDREMNIEGLPWRGRP